MIIEGILLGIFGTAAYDLLKQLFFEISEGGDHVIFDKVYIALNESCKKFFDKFGEKYGKPENSFLANQKNLKLIMNSIYFSNNTVLKDTLNRNGFGDDIPALSDEDLEYFISELNQAMRKDFELDKILASKEFMVNQTNSQNALLAKMDKILQYFNESKPNNNEERIVGFLKGKNINFYESKVLKIEDTSGFINGRIEFKVNDFIRQFTNINDLIMFVSLHPEETNKLEPISFKLYYGQELMEQYDYIQDYSGPTIVFDFVSEGRIEITTEPLKEKFDKEPRILIIPHETEPQLKINLEDANYNVIIPDLPLYIESRKLIEDNKMQIILSNIYQNHPIAHIKLIFVINHMDIISTSINIKPVISDSAYYIMQCLKICMRLLNTKTIFGRSIDDNSIVFQANVTMDMDELELEKDIDLFRTILNIERIAGVKFKIPPRIMADEAKEIYELNDILSNGILYLPPMTLSTAGFTEVNSELMSEENAFIFCFNSDVIYNILGLDFDLGEAQYIISKAVLKHMDESKIEFESCKDSKNLCIIRKYYGDYNLEQILEREGIQKKSF